MVRGSSSFNLMDTRPFKIASSSESIPEPMEYPMKKIPVRHYGNMIFETLDRLKKMPPGSERDRLTQMVANQMKRNLVQWGHGAPDDDKIVADLEHFTDGKIRITTDDVGKDSRYDRRKRKK